VRVEATVAEVVETVVEVEVEAKVVAVVEIGTLVPRLRRLYGHSAKANQH